MRYSLGILMVLLLMCPLFLDAQTNVTIKRKDFKLEKAGFDDAWKHVEAGNAFFIKRGIWYNDAFNEYLQALVYNSSNAELNYKTGVSALFSDKKEEAAGFLQKAIELNKNVAEDVMLLTGRALQYSGKFPEAVEKYTAYLSSSAKKSKENIQRAREWIGECNSAVILTKDTLRISVENFGANINSDADDYSEVFSSDGKTMYFASRRELPSSGKRNPDTRYDENIFISLLGSGGWESCTPAGKNINTKYCEAPLYLSNGGDLLYVYNGSSGKGDIKVSVRKKGLWQDPKNVPFPVNSGAAETSFTISPSGNEIYFVSGRKHAGLGGKDIYFIKKLNDRKWSKPQNAGTLINTIYDEEGVHLSKTGDTLWFSSRGHNTMGGFDIFFSIRSKTGAWDTVRNAGYPLNTPWDELFYYPSPVGDSSFYFVSNRSGGLGGTDIYHGSILPPVKIIIPPPAPDTVVVRDTIVIAPPEPVIPKEQPVLLTGRVNDSDNGDPLLAKIDVKDISTGEILITTASSEEDGSYNAKLPDKKSFMVDIHSTGYLSDMKRIDIPGDWPKDSYILNIDLIKVKIGKKVVLNNIFFETGKSVLTPGSYTELDHLLIIMKENSQMKIEVSGHTDKTGSEALNFRLSEARAKAVVEYLVKMGIDRSRMEFKGYGPLQPVGDNNTAAGRAKNRRVEFKILEF